MLNRLRQRQSSKPGLITGECYLNGRIIANYANVMSSLCYDAQNVYDFFDKRKVNFRVRSEVPPLREVMMSKLSINTSTDLVEYGVTVYPYVYKLRGANLAGAVYDDPIYGDFKPRKELSFCSVDSSVASWLLQRAYSKMSTAEFDFAVPLGEVFETAKLIAKPLTGIAHLSRKFLSGVHTIHKVGPRVAVRMAKNATSRQISRIKANSTPLKSGLHLLDESANHWLEYKFGVCPLIDDVGKLLEFKEKNVQEHLGVRLAKVKGPLSDQTSWKLFTVGSFGYFRFNCTVVRRLIDRHYCGLYFRNKSTEPLTSFMENLGFAPWQLPSVAYELIPLSFVVDRFIDIKSFVRGNLGSLSKETFGSYCTRKQIESYAYALSNVCYDTSGPMGYNRQLVSQALVERVTRSINLERPRFPVVNPYWRDQLIADATNLSLIWGRLRNIVGKSF